MPTEDADDDPIRIFENIYTQISNFGVGPEPDSDQFKFSIISIPKFQILESVPNRIRTHGNVSLRENVYPYVCRVRLRIEHKYICFFNFLKNLTLPIIPMNGDNIDKSLTHWNNLQNRFQYFPVYSSLCNGHGCNGHCDTVTATYMITFTIDGAGEELVPWCHCKADGECHSGCP